MVIKKLFPFVLALILFWPTFSSAATSWRDDFDALNTSFWQVSRWSMPGSIENVNQGIAEPSYVSAANGYLVMKLTQEYGQVGTNSQGVISRGSGVNTFGTYGYGTYEWRMRMSSTSTSPTGPSGDALTGSVAAGFNYVNNSQTEIDFEQEGQAPATLWMTSWINPDPATNNYSHSYLAKSVPGMSQVFKTYKFIWEPGKVTYYVDDVLQGALTTNVGSAPAYFMMNHWGTNSTGWGGLATVGADRYVYIDWVRYTAPGETSVPVPTVPDTEAPLVAITSPKDGAVVKRNQNISASASDNVKVTKVDFYADGIRIASDTSAPYGASWNTRKVTNGLHTIQAIAYDAAGNSKSAQVTVRKGAIAAILQGLASIWGSF